MSIFRFHDMIASTSPVILAVFAILLLMSVITWTIVLMKTIQYFRLYLRLSKDIRFLETSPEALTLAELLKRGPHSMVRSMTRQTIHMVKHKKRQHGTLPSSHEMSAWVRSGNAEIIEEAIRPLQAGLPILAICTNTAPLLGLFGTVWGIMRSFHAYAELKATTLATVGPGIADALSTTALGLVVAIPATLAYNMFLVLLSNRETDLQYCAKHMVQVFEDEISTNNAPAPPDG